MFKKIIILLSLLGVLVLKGFADDTLRVMQYNLLYYDKVVHDCNEENNGTDHKNTQLKVIFGEFMPDIFTVNEMNGSESSVNKILNDVFNADGVSHYKRANYTGDYIVNMLYYNTRKLELHSQSTIPTMVSSIYERTTDVYKLYYKSEDLAQTNDTIFLTCIVAHLKAGSYYEDQQIRHDATKMIMSHISNNNINGNVMMMGDFNVYNSSEDAFQEFVSSSASLRFYDPVNKLGDWHDNPYYSDYHTQSTHTSSGNNCPSAGGMDDRFDFILTSLPILNGSDGLKYIEDSYWAFGQDGNRLNQSLNSPTNNSLPSDVINALYYMSDHLPVVLKLHVDANPASTADIHSDINHNFRVTNPINNHIKVWSDVSDPETMGLQITNLLGNTIINERVTFYPGDETKIDTSILKPGIYLLTLKNGNYSFSKRLIKS
ncbi:MAG: T9SS type A sorting domain-containing protein [Bacteroidales bacterium]